MLRLPIRCHLTHRFIRTHNETLSSVVMCVKMSCPTAAFVVLNEILGSDDCAGLNGAERRL